MELQVICTASSQALLKEQCLAPLISSVYRWLGSEDIVALHVLSLVCESFPWMVGTTYPRNHEKHGGWQPSKDTKRCVNGW